jgi:hypothetical protein
MPEPQQFRLKQLTKELIAYDIVPLFPKPIDFPWQKLAESMAQTFHLNDFSITPSEVYWQYPYNLLKGLGTSAHRLSLNLSPLSGSLHWIMSQQDLTLLMSWVLGDNNLAESSLFEGFYYFIATAILSSIEKLNILQPLSPRIANEKPLPDEPALCLDVALKLGEQSIWGRLVIAADLRQSWQEFQMQKSSREQEHTLATSLEVNITAEAGHVLLTYEQFSHLTSGDFVILDNCSINPATMTGQVIIKANNKPVITGTMSGDGKVHVKNQ